MYITFCEQKIRHSWEIFISHFEHVFYIHDSARIVHYTISIVYYVHLQYKWIYGQTVAYIYIYIWLLPLSSRKRVSRMICDSAVPPTPHLFHTDTSYQTRAMYSISTYIYINRGGKNPFPNCPNCCCNKVYGMCMYGMLMR